MTTLRHAGALLDPFIAHHLALGFSRLYLVFDDPADPDLARVADSPGVVAIPGDDAHRLAWRELPLFAAMGPSVEREVMARQVLNASLAMRRARQDGCDWLLHIDIDELFWSPHESAADHFGALKTAPFDVVVYRNYEAVPEADDVADPMREVTLFKTPPARLARLPAASVATVVARFPRFATGPFNLYSNGKSAVRLRAEGLEPQGVHIFGRPGGSTPHAVSDQHFILHYACCGFQTFVDKYRTLGRFADRWWDRYDIAAAIGPFHLQARDVVMGGDRDAALAFYRDRIALEDPEAVATLIAAGVLERITGPADALS